MKKIQYWGAGNIHEGAITGTSRLWYTGMSDDVTDAESVALLAYSSDFRIDQEEDVKKDNVVTFSKTLTGGIELWANGEQVSVGGGGISPDATGTLANRSAYNAEAVGFVYLATDQVPAEYYFREGAAGNWSAAVEVQGPTGATGATGATGPAGPAGVDGVTFVSGTAAPDNGDGRPDGTVYVRYTV